MEEILLRTNGHPRQVSLAGRVGSRSEHKVPVLSVDDTAMAQFHGATQEELAEEYYLASFTVRWSAMVHAQNYDWDTFTQEAKQMGEGLQKRATK